MYIVPKVLPNGFNLRRVSGFNSTVFLASGTSAAPHCFVLHPTPCCLFAPPHFLCTFRFQVTNTMLKRTATGPSTLPKRKRVAMGVNLRTISESMSVADIANDAGDSDACKNAQVSGPWDSCNVREKASNASQDSECASQASDLSDMSDDSCFA